MVADNCSVEMAIHYFPRA